MVLPAIAAFIPPVVKWLFGSYVFATGSTILIYYTVLTASVFSHFWGDSPDILEGFDILKTVQGNFNKSNWYQELGKDEWYSLALKQARFEIQSNIYVTERYSCQTKQCQVHTKFQFEGMKVPEAIRSSVETILKLPKNYTTPTVTPMKFDITKSLGSNIVFQSILVNLKLIKQYQNNSLPDEMFELSLPVAYEKTRIGFYSIY